MRIMITGGAGFIGSAVVRHLIAEGVDALVVDKLTYAGNLASLREVSESPRFTLAQTDICNGEAIRGVFGQYEPDAVMHLAAETHVDRSITGAEAFIQTNIAGTFQLLEAARAYWERLGGARRDSFRFLHVSTDEVYGSLGETGLFREGDRYEPRSPYAASKAASDHLVRAWGHTYGLPVLVSNCSNNYGPRQLPEKLIPLMILNGLEGLALPVYGDGRNVRDWLYVEDHARALWTILRNGRVGQTYHVGGGNERTNLEVVYRICDLLDTMAPSQRPRREQVRFVADRPGHDRRYGVDASKLKSELGWRAAHPFESGIEATVRWYIDNSAWWEPLREAGHGRGRLGLPAQQP